MKSPNRSDPFTGIRLKLTRAWDQLNGLRRDIARFLDDDPSPYEPRVEFNADRHELIVRVQVQKTVDPMWGVRIGEIIHDLRSALDHVVWELVVHNTRLQPKTKKTQFPIFEHEAGFDDRGVKQFLKGVSNNAIALVRSEQPFHAYGGGVEGDKSPLWHLKELSDIDKHRTLHVTGSMVEAFEFTFPPLKQEVVVQRHVRLEPGPLEQDVVLGRALFQGITAWPFAGHEVSCTLRTDIAFEPGTPAPGTWVVFATLADVANRTERILRRIAEDIFGSEL